MKFIIFGAGNIAHNIVHNLIAKDYEIIQIVGRSKSTAQKLAHKYKLNFTVNYSDIKKDADIYILAVNDSSIGQIIKSIKMNDQLVIHTSGSVSIDVFHRTCKNYGVFYPLQTFSKNKLLDFLEVPVCIEANNAKSLKKIEELANHLSNSVLQVNSEQRKTLHIAAVFASNFVNHMYTQAEEILKGKDIDFEILKPLIKETTNKVLQAGPVNSQTGPAIRKDMKIVDSHIKYLSGKGNMKDIYKLITDSIINYYFSKNNY